MEWLLDRPKGVPLIIILPPPSSIADLNQFVRDVYLLGPTAILPVCHFIEPDRLKGLLNIAPRQIPSAVTHYLERRGLLRTSEIRAEIGAILELSAEVTSVARLSRRLSTSRRTLGRHCVAAGIPVPSHWLQFGRLLHFAMRIHSHPGPIGRLAPGSGYPDPFTLSNQMKRLLGCRPSEVRRYFGWQWIVEAWIAEEARAGRIDPERYRDLIKEYLEDAGEINDEVDEHEERDGLGS